MSAVALPEAVESEGVDLTTYYQRQHGWFFGFFLATLAVSVIKDVVVDGRLPSPVNLSFHVFLAAAAISALLLRNRRFHELVGVASAAAMITYIILLFAQLR